MSRAKPRYGPGGYQLTDDAAARLPPGTDNRLSGELFVAVDLCCRECHRKLWRYCLDTFDGAAGEVYAVGRAKGGVPLGFVPAVVGGFLLIHCEHCERDLNAPLTHVQAVLEDMRSQGRHAVERLFV